MIKKNQRKFSLLMIFTIILSTFQPFIANLVSANTVNSKDVFYETDEFENNIDEDDSIIAIEVEEENEEFTENNKVITDTEKVIAQEEKEPVKNKGDPVKEKTKEDITGEVIEEADLDVKKKNPDSSDSKKVTTKSLDEYPKTIDIPINIKWEKGANNPVIVEKKHESDFGHSRDSSYSVYIRVKKMNENGEKLDEFQLDMRDLGFDPYEPINEDWEYVLEGLELDNEGEYYDIDISMSDRSGWGAASTYYDYDNKNTNPKYNNSVSQVKNIKSNEDANFRFYLRRTDLNFTLISGEESASFDKYCTSGPTHKPISTDDKSPKLLKSKEEVLDLSGAIFNFIDRNGDLAYEVETDNEGKFVIKDFIMDFYDIKQKKSSKGHKKYAEVLKADLRPYFDWECKANVFFGNIKLDIPLTVVKKEGEKDNSLEVNEIEKEKKPEEYFKLKQMVEQIEEFISSNGYTEDDFKNNVSKWNELNNELLPDVKNEMSISSTNEAVLETLTKKLEKGFESIFQCDRPPIMPGTPPEKCQNIPKKPDILYDNTEYEKYIEKMKQQEEERESKVTGDLEGAVFELKKDGEVVQTLTTNKKGVANVNGIEEGNYTIQEIKSPEGYILDEKEYQIYIKEGVELEYIFTAYNEPIKKIDILVEKEWKNADSKDRPEFIEVDLLRNGKVLETVKITSQNEWKYVFKDLDKTDNEGKEYEYTVQEKEVEGYESSVTGNAEAGFTITNTKIVPPTPIVPAKTKVDVEKVWKGKAQDSVTINLLADGKKVDSVKLSDENDWKHTFTDLPVVNDIKDEKAIEYTVEEVEIDGYEVSIDGNAKDGFVVTNTEINENKIINKTPYSSVKELAPIVNKGELINKETKQGKSLPNTATNNINLLILGIGVLFISSLLFIFLKNGYKRRKA